MDILSQFFGLRMALIVLEAQVARNRVFSGNTALHLVEAAKNPVSLVFGWSETAFFCGNTASSLTEKNIDRDP